MTWQLNLGDRVRRLRERLADDPPGGQFQESVQQPLSAFFVRLGNLLDGNVRLIVAAAAIVLVILTSLAWYESQKAADTAQTTFEATRASFVAAQRAGVYFQGLQFTPVQEDGRPLMWHVGPVWQNAGSTPTKALTFELICPRLTGKIDHDRIDPYELRGSFAPLFMSSLIGPGQSQLGGVCEISPEEMERVKEGRLALFVVAVARYQNTLEHKSAHETWQCMRVANLAGNFEGPEGPAPSYAGLPCGGRPNCADDDCKGRRK
jgi:hypothetical protein